MPCYFRCCFSSAFSVRSISAFRRARNHQQAFYFFRMFVWWKAASQSSHEIPAPRTISWLKFLRTIDDDRDRHRIKLKWVSIHESATIGAKIESVECDVKMSLIMALGNGVHRNNISREWIIDWSSSTWKVKLLSTTLPKHIDFVSTIYQAHIQCLPSTVRRWTSGE